MMSSRSLKPWDDSRGASSSTAARRIMKKPLPESLRSTLVIMWAATCDSRLMQAALAGEAVGRAAGDVAAPHHDVDVALANAFEHGAEQGLVVLHVGIEHGDVAGLARHHALDAGAGEAAPADPADTADAAVGGAERAHDRGGSVRRVVVDEDDLPRHVVEGALEQFDHERHVVVLVVGRHDDAELRRRGDAGIDRGRRLGQLIHGHPFTKCRRRGAPAPPRVARGPGCPIHPPVRQCHRTDA